MALKQISVFLENRPGQLARACKALADRHVSLIALSLAETQEFGIARLIVDDGVRAAEVLRAERFLVTTTSVTAVVVPDRPGGMSEVAMLLSENGCDIEYSYAFAFRHASQAVLVFRFKDDDDAQRVLAEAGFSTLHENQLHEAAN